jgi:acyl-CoA dehydrogenase
VLTWGWFSLALTALLLDTAVAGFTATPLPTLGLRAAGLGHLRLDQVTVSPEQILGRHLPATRRGLWAALRLFNRARPLVAAVAVGVARAAYQYVLAHRAVLPAAGHVTLDRIAHRLVATSLLVHRAAAAVDAEPSSGYLGSTAKVRAVSLAEDTTAAALTFFGPAARLEHPFLDKLARDARGLEFMEGTTNIQKLNLVAGFHRGHIGHV